MRSKASDKFWQQTLTALGRHLGVERPEVERRVVCVDAHRQWRNWRNLWYNAAARSLGQTLSSPIGGSRRRAARR
jgi:hypothetical protein